MMHAAPKITIIIKKDLSIIVLVSFVQAVVHPHEECVYQPGYHKLPSVHSLSSLLPVVIIDFQTVITLFAIRFAYNNGIIAFIHK